MITNEAENINTAWPSAWSMFERSSHVTRRNSRAGPTIEFTRPVATRYLNPMQRVLFDPIRDANPFFHLMEALWILGGRDDVKFLAKFNARMADYSDNGVIFHAPYGYRLRTAFGIDQLNVAVDMLRNDPTTRRVVLQIWDAAKDLGTESRDIPCNDMAFLSPTNGTLHMTVCCRSNDAIWGCYGANAVQFSFLLEYIALKAGYKVGTLTQMSNNLHMYTLSETYKRIVDHGGPVCMNLYRSPFNVVPLPLMANEGERTTFDNELIFFLEGDIDRLYDMPFLAFVAVPMFLAYEAYRHEDLDRAVGILQMALREANSAHGEIDWLCAGVNWLKRRVLKRMRGE
jgi:hypothetical protein